MKSFSYTIAEEKQDSYASARVESVDGSYKELSQVCAAIKHKKTSWAVDFLTNVMEGDTPVLFSKFNKKMGHRRGLGGKKGRYPKKAAKLVLNVLRSALGNARVKGLGDDTVVVHAAANKKYTYPRIASKGRRAKANYELARIEIIVKDISGIPKGVTVKKPGKPDIQEKTPEKKDASKQAEKPAVKSGTPVPKPEAAVQKKAEEKMSPAKVKEKTEAE